MGHGHRPHVGDAASVRIVTFTASSSRTPETDEGGTLLGSLLREAGFTLQRHAIVPDDREAIREAIRSAFASGDCDAVIVTGGTGIAPGDVTYSAVTDVLDDVLDGFGEAFRRHSWDEVGARAMLSRAIGGRYGEGVVFALPGSPAAVRLGVTKLLAPMLAHVVALVRPESTHG